MTNKGDTNGKSNDDIDGNDITGLAGTALPYLFHGFRKGLEGRTFVGLSIQCPVDGVVKGSVRAIKNVGRTSESGIVTYVSGESFGEVLASLELAISYDDARWSKDNFYERTVESVVKRRVNTTKLNLDTR